jgi:hypothetical protein
MRFSHNPGEIGMAAGLCPGFRKMLDREADLARKMAICAAL